MFCLFGLYFLLFTFCFCFIALCFCLLVGFFGFSVVDVFFFFTLVNFFFNHCIIIKMSIISLIRAYYFFSCPFKGCTFLYLGLHCSIICIIFLTSLFPSEDFLSFCLIFHFISDYRRQISVSHNLYQKI